MIQNIRGLHLAHSLLLALNLREYQIVCASVHIVIHVDAGETYLYVRVNYHGWNVHIQVILKVIGFSQEPGFSACSDMVATAIVFEISRLCQMYTFPDQMMNCQFVLIMARNHQ